MCTDKFGGLAEFGMDAAQSLFIQKHAGTIRLMSQTVSLVPERSRLPCHDSLPSRDSVSGGPILGKNPLMFLRCKIDFVLPAATATVVAAPVLHHGKFESHERVSVLSELMY